VNYIKANIQSILSIHRLFKILIAIVTDIVLCILCTWFAFVLRLEELILLKNFKQERLKNCKILGETSIALDVDHTLSHSLHKKNLLKLKKVIKK
jgi:hypothetical protein